MSFSPSIIGTGLSGYRFLARTQDAQMTAFTQSPQPAQDTAHFKATIKAVQTADQLLDDRTLLRVALGAFGLDEDIDNRAFLRGVLESDLNNPASAANRLSDKRYLALAKTFNFADSSGARLPDSSAADDIRAILTQIDDPDLLLRNENLLNRTLQAFDLQDYATQPAFLKQVLSADLAQSDALVYRLNDSRFVELAQAFQGKDSGLSPALLANVSDSVAGRLQGLQTASDLVSDPRLLRSALAVFGLEDDANNGFMIEQVLNSDLTDPDSFANSLRDPAYVELAAAFGFQERAVAASSVYAYADRLSTALPDLETADDLLDRPELLAATLDIFGLESEDTDFLKSVLESDLTDADSVANTQEDPRFRAMAGAFGFGEILTGSDKDDAQSDLVELVATVADRSPVRTSADLFRDAPLMLATMNFFDVPLGEWQTRYAGRVMEALSTDPDAPFLPRDDPRYETMHAAMNFRPEQTGRTYPAGFAEAVTEQYLERQFEIAVGDVDPSLRIALSFERELTDAVGRASTNDGQWFTVMASPQLRTVFESALGLPSSFAGLDLNQQLGDLKDRSQRAFGTSTLSEMLGPDLITQIRDQYLGTLAAPVQSAAPTLLSGAAGANGLLNLLV